MTVLRDELQRALGSAYTLERELVGGGMSTVFVARDNALGRTVVIKVLPYELAATVSVDRFNREIMFAATLQHPHIVPVLSAGETDGLPFFIMPFVEGESLRARLGRGPLSVRETVSILKDVARALAYAHGRGVIHRDIKPDNILLSSGSATVTDFGVAKAITASRERQPPAATPASDSITHVGTSIGTPAYMAPEQAAGDPALDHRADLYALGIVGYEMLVGTPPFHGMSPQQLMIAQLTQAPPPIEARRYDVPEALSALLMRLLEKDPAKRPKSAADVARALDDPEVVSGTFAATRVARSRKPRRVVWALAGAGILASVAAGSEYLHNRLTGVGSAAPHPAGTAVAQSIAVLPLVNLGTDTGDVYFARGMTGDLTNALSRIRGLRVVSPTAAEAVRQRVATDEAVGKELNVSMVLEGTVQREGGRLRVTARLVKAADGVTLWSDVFDRTAKDVFAVQDDISNAIVAAIAPEISTATGVASASTAQGTSDLRAYDLYLRGRFYFQQRGAAALQRALDSFRQATREDSTFARAYAGIADVLGVLPLYTNTSIDSVMPAALAAIDRAIRLDSLLPEAFTSRASLEQAQWKWNDAERDYRRAIALDPNDANAHQWYGELLLVMGRTDAARAELGRAAALNPLGAITAASRALALVAARVPDSAVAVGRSALALDSSLAQTHFMLGTIYLETGRAAEGLKQLLIASKMDSSSSTVRGLLGYAYAKVGDTVSARRIITNLEAAGASGPRRGIGSAVARVYLGLGDTGRALDQFERAASAHDAMFESESLLEPLFDPARADPRFAAIVKRVGLDPRVLAR